MVLLSLCNHEPTSHNESFCINLRSLWVLFLWRTLSSTGFGIYNFGGLAEF